MQDIKLRIKGLYSQPNNYSEVPEGALRTADNIVVDREGVANPRRGFNFVSGAPGATDDRVKVLVEYQDKLIAQYGDSSLAYYNDSNAWTDISTSVTPPTDCRMRFVLASGNCYFTTNTGVKKIEAYNASSASTMGVQKAIHSTVALSASSGSALTTGNSVAYRYLWGIKDANDNLIRSAPSGRVEVANSSGSTKDIDHTVYIPQTITTSHFLQVYRSKEAASSPSDELYLVYEVSPSSSDITNGYLTFSDATPESLLGALLYTNPSQESITQANDQPPLAEDIEVYKDHTFFANTATKHRFYVSLLGVGSPNGIQADDTITVAGQTYTAKASPSTATQFSLVTSGSASQNIADTANSLVAKINQNTSNTTVYAYYISGPDDLPGKLLIEERSVGGSAFTVQVSRASAWSPEGLDTAQSSTNDDWANGLYFSKPGQPEAVPILNYVRVGSASDPIMRIKALRDTLFIFKRSEGVYILTGDSANNFSVSLLDSSVRLLAKETLAVLNNQIYALFDQGVCAVTETGVQVLSRPIEKTLLELQGEALEQIKDYAWAVGYESDRKYILNLPTSDIDTYTTQAYVYNHISDAWTRWDIDKNAGLVRPSNSMLYVADALSNKVSVERKSYSFRDHADEGLTTSISSISDTTITLADALDIAEGDVLYQSDTLFSVITDVSGAVVTVGYNPGFTAASCQVLKAFTCTVEWHPHTGGDHMLLKQWREASLLFEKRPRNCTISFSTELDKQESSVTIESTSISLWGSFEWGSAPWGGVSGEAIFRTLVTKTHQRASNLRMKWQHTLGYSNWAMAGVKILFNPIGNRVTR